MGGGNPRIFAVRRPACPFFTHLPPRTAAMVLRRPLTDEDLEFLALLLRESRGREPASVEVRVREGTTRAATCREWAVQDVRTVLAGIARLPASREP